MSCSTILDGKMLIFGGWLSAEYGEQTFGEQITVVENCGLTRIGKLPFVFRNGACNTYQKSNGDSQALLCFSEWSYDHEQGCHT